MSVDHGVEDYGDVAGVFEGGAYRAADVSGAAGDEDFLGGWFGIVHGGGYDIWRGRVGSTTGPLFGGAGLG